MSKKKLRKKLLHARKRTGSLQLMLYLTWLGIYLYWVFDFLKLTVK